jgi:hypothetical protein
MKARRPRRQQRRALEMPRRQPDRDLRSATPQQTMSASQSSCVP